ncbi:MAG TPA: ABC transporter ATP-binding protein [Cyclobacteriaceae bacterium]|jgi:Cu-processing system ATP-binding protein|nr:ABC transporter ATP-binding protein [Cyclobacteriaceae bacterium]
MITISDLYKRFGRLEVLKSIQVEFELGKSYAVVGPNGSGKTTLIKCILGMVVPDRGQILVDGKSILQSSDYRKLIGYMPQIGRYPDQMKIGQIIDMICDLRKDETQVDEDLIKEFKLDQLKDKRMHTLSGGTRQKVSASLAFLFNPPILILDEPTAGLDPIAVEILKEKIHSEKNKNKLFLITSHIMSDLDELSSNLVYLEDGKMLFNDTIDALKKETGEIKLGRAVATIMKRNLKGIEVS